jgi:Sulfotransferase family
MTQRPLFLLSLPRSGSTLVQRVLAVHDEISTVPETWLLLPQVYAMRERGAFAEYGHTPASRAIREFADALPGGRDAYDEDLRRFVLALYARASGGAGTYFLDKTPRYHYVADDLFRIFPDAKVVFLWRNPLAIVASITETWGRGRWNVGRWRNDLYDGVANLVASYESHADRAHAVRYEDLVQDRPAVWQALFDYLELPFDSSALTAFRGVDLRARMGDPTGSTRYETITMESLDRWRATLRTPVRKRWCRRYLDWIGDARLSAMGYEMEALTDALDAVPLSARRLPSDLARGTYAWFNRVGRQAAAALLWRKRQR